MNDSWPDYVIAALREALPAFDPIIKVYVRTDAVLTGVEVRTSSPVHLRRDHAYQSVNTTGLCLARVTPAASYRRR